MSLLLQDIYSETKDNRTYITYPTYITYKKQEPYNEGNSHWRMRQAGQHRGTGGGKRPAAGL